MFSLFLLYAACSSEDALKTFNANPTISIGSHIDGAQIQEGYETQFWAQVGDSDHTHNELFVLWYFNQEEVCPETSPDVSGQALCMTRIEDSGTLTAQVRDAQDAGANDSIELTITPTYPPTAQILAPLGSSPLYSDRLITFEGRASDSEDEPEQLSVWWDSSIDGMLPLSAELDSSGNTTSAGYLSEGEHLLQFFVQDQSETTTSDSLTIQVGGPNQTPDCSIVSPLFDSIFIEGETILFEGMVSDAELSASLLAVSWESDKDGLLGQSTPSTQGEVFFSTTLSSNTHTVTLSVQDELGAICTTPVVVTIGTAPIITIDAPTNGSTVNRGESTLFIGTVQDNTDATSQLISWESDIDGILSTTPASSNGVVQFATSDLSAGSHNIFCIATDPTGLIGQDLIQIYVNQPPISPVVSITPSTPQTTDDLQAAASATDPDNDPVSYTYQWQKNGISTTHSGSSMLATNTTKGEIWTVTVTADDGMMSSASVSADVQIQNTAPIISALTITPTAPSNQDTLTCTATVVDPDEAPVLSYSWTNANGDIVSTSSTLHLIPSMAQGGDIFSCTVLATDSDGAMDSSSSTISIQNTAPVIQSVIITPSQPVNDDTVTCSVAASDADNDPLIESYTWYNNTTGQTLGTGQTLSLHASTISPNHDLACVVTVSDPSGGTDTSDSTAILGNRDPIISDVSLSPDPLYNTDIATCTITSSDPDGDALAETFSWSNQTTSTVLGSNSTLTLTPGYISPQETLLCSAIVSDPHGGTMSMDGTIVLDNRAPTVSSAAITPTSPTSADDLTCLASGGSDPDGQTVSYQYRWYRNGSLDAQTGSTLYAPHIQGETITCEVLPGDGMVTGTEVSTSVSISNSPPSITALSILPNPLYTNDVAYLDITASDQDGDTITYIYSWAINTNSGGTFATLDSSLFSRGDIVDVAVTPSDSFSSGQPHTASITVSNSAPEQPQMELPSAPKEGVDDLVCTVVTGSIDHDGDSIDYSISWGVDGIPYTGATQTTVWTGDTVSAALTNVGEEWTCTATPNDGLEDGTPDSATTTIQNANTRVFVTSNTWNGDLGGLSGADDKCQQSADDAGLGGTWVAFLSNGTSASSRIPEGPYVRLDGATIANDKGDLLDGSISVPINLNETGGTNSGFVFTGSNASGSSYGSSTNGLCVGWTRGCGVCYGNHFYAQVGRADRSNDDWVDVGWVKCHTGSHLYCFEQ